jgi:hypothetical protein
VEFGSLEKVLGIDIGSLTGIFELFWQYLPKKSALLLKVMGMGFYFL